MSERMSDRMEAITKWQDATGDTLRELGRSVQTIPQDVSLYSGFFVSFHFCTTGFMEVTTTMLGHFLI